MLLAHKIEATRSQDRTIPQCLHLENGGRPAWLLSAYSSNTWTVTDTGDRPNVRIEFDVRLPGGSRLVEHPNLLGSIKRVLYGVRTGPLMQFESGRGQQQVADNMTTLVRWMMLNGIRKFEELTELDISEYVEHAPYGVHTILNSEGVLNRHLESLLSQADFRDADSPTERRAKAALIFPTCAAAFAGGSAVLNRNRLMADAGLEGVGINGANSALLEILDEVTDLCCFSTSAAMRQRLSTASDVDPDDQKVTTEQVRRLLMPFSLLYRHRRYLDDALQRSPFPGNSASALAKKLGSTVGRTSTVPVKQAICFIERSVRWVVDYSNDLLDIKAQADAWFDKDPITADAHMVEFLRSYVWPVQGPASPFPLKPGTWPSGARSDEINRASNYRGEMTLQQALNYLVSACSVVIAAFSARRASEVLGLKASCIERDSAGLPWLRSFIYKTIQEESVVPVPEVVVLAVDVLIRLSERARRQTGSPYLMQYNLPGTDTCVGLSSDGKPVFRFNWYVREFGYFADVPCLDDGTPWTFRPHQFRRFFAILYIWIYELGDWSALAWHLRHFSLEMTRRYVTDVELGHIIAMANREHTATVIARAALGQTQIAGIRGTRLKEAAKRIFDRLNQRVQAVSERKFHQRILRFVERAGVTLLPLPWGYYAASLANRTDAPLGSLGFGQNSEIENATVSKYKDGTLALSTSAGLPSLSQSIEFHRKVSESGQSPEMLRLASKAFVNDAKAYALLFQDAPSGSNK